MILNLEEAEIIASEHIKSFGEISPGFKLGISKPRIFNNCFYFDYLIVPIDPTQNLENPMFGGAPGITIDKASRVVTVISHSLLHQLESQDSI